MFVCQVKLFLPMLTRRKKRRERVGSKVCSCLYISAFEENVFVRCYFYCLSEKKPYDVYSKVDGILHNFYWAHFIINSH